MAAHRCGRGVFGLKDWNPERRVGHLAQGGIGTGQLKQNKEPVVGQASKENGLHNGSITMDTRSQGNNTDSTVENGASTACHEERAMMAKYSWKTKEGPLGHELEVRQGEKLTRVDIHPENDHWWLARNASGDVGLVPASYMLLEEKSTQLPWLQNRDLDAAAEQKNSSSTAEKSAYAPYQSAYNRVENHQCNICNRSFNGPIPYNVHLKSKAHKEELEAQGLL